MRCCDVRHVASYIAAYVLLYKKKSESACSLFFALIVKINRNVLPFRYYFVIMYRKK